MRARRICIFSLTSRARSPTSGESFTAQTDSLDLAPSRTGRHSRSLLSIARRHSARHRRQPRRRRRPRHSRFDRRCANYSFARAARACSCRVPFFGISPRTAIAALFLYGLLPIVRNTATGLQDIAQPFRESAIALGLEPSRASAENLSADRIAHDPRAESKPAR